MVEVKIVNERKFQKDMQTVVLAMSSEIVEEALKDSVDAIINELPKGSSSSIAPDIHIKKISDHEFLVETTNPVWDYLNYGTGIYGPAHTPIVPVNAKALHFKNIEIALALGFPDENVFLKKVKGIRPRYFFDRYFYTASLQRRIDAANRKPLKTVKA